MTVRVAVHGAGGRMGLAVARVLAEHDEAKLVAALEHRGHARLGEDIGTLAGLSPLGVLLNEDLEAGLRGADVVIDFSVPAACAGMLEVSQAIGVASVIGTTGLDANCQGWVESLKRKAPVVVAANFSAGVTTLVHLAQQAVRTLGPEYDIEIVEMHHKYKRDAPSGTALRLYEAVAEAAGVDPEKARVSARFGEIGPRAKGEIGVMALRGGSVVGDHTVVLAGQDERLELTHLAQDRSIFARGAVRAAVWAARQPAGLYGMEQVLGLQA